MNVAQAGILFLLSIVLVSFHSAAIAQSINWSYIADEVSNAECFTSTADGAYLIVNNTSGIAPTNNVAKVNSTGDLIWELSLEEVTGSTIIYAGELSNQDLVFVATNGEIYRTDASGRSPELVNQFAPSTFSEILELRYDVAHLDEVHFVGSVDTNGTRKTLRASFNLQTLAITTHIGTDESYPNGVAFSDSGIRAELLTSPSASFILFYDENLQITSLVDVTQASTIIFSDLSFDSNGNLYVTGTETSTDDFFIHNGIIACIDSNRTLSWIRRIPRPLGFESLGLKHIITKTGRIFIGGRSGPNVESIDNYLGEIDDQGNLLWEKTFNLVGRNEAVESLEFVTGTNPEELLVLGTGGLTDFIGPQRTYLTSIGINTSSTDDSHPNTASNYYPNPVVDMLHFERRGIEQKIKLMDASGVSITSIPAGATSFDMSSYPAGIYYLNEYIGGVFRSTKVIKQ